MIPAEQLIEVGQWYIWSRPGVWEPCQVTAKSDGKEETHIQSRNLRGNLCWNDEEWFREACELPTAEQVAFFESETGRVLVTAKLVYHIRKTNPLADPEGECQWLLIRSANVEAAGHAVGVLPEVDVAVFTSEAEANMFYAYLREIEKKCD